MAPNAQVRIGARTLSLSNLDKVLYPQVGFTKAHVLDYYTRIAPYLLPHLQGRPLTLKRYPEGVDAPFFYEKRCPSHRPAWVETADVWSGHNQGYIPFCLANDLPTLIWVANLASLELHTSLSLAAGIERPTMMVFDLDPGLPADILDCCAVGLMIRELLDRVGLESFAKTSGSKGLQVYVPLNTKVTYEDTKGFARTVAELLERERPDRVVSKMNKELRRGKVLVDWSQNDEHKTTVCVYSLRAMPRPTVSAPVSWREVEQVHARADRALLSIDSDQVLARVERMGDLFAPVLTREQSLPGGVSSKRARQRRASARTRSR